MRQRYQLYLLLLALCFHSGCRANGTDGITGRYQSKEYSFVGQIYLFYVKHATYVVRSTLEIRADSTYTIRNCGNIATGVWQVRNDSLLLFCRQNRWAIDSLNESGFNGKKPPGCSDGTPTVYLIDQDELKRQWTDGSRTILNHFEKIEE